MFSSAFVRNTQPYICRETGKNLEMTGSGPACRTVMYAKRKVIFILLNTTKTVLLVILRQRHRLLLVDAIQLRV